MSSTTPKLIKELRQRTGSGMLDCKNALKESSGDLDKAVTALRESGLAKAAKKSSNIAAEGLISILVNDDSSKATILELNSQTDFVAKNDNFIKLSKQILSHASLNDINNSDDLLSSNINGTNFTEFLNSNIATIGENIVARKLTTVNSKVVNAYVHSNGKVGVILGATCNDNIKDKVQVLLKNIAMHASAMKPSVISYKDLSEEFIRSENKAIVAEIETLNEELVRLKKPLKNIPDFVSKAQLTQEALDSVKKRFEDELKEQGKPEKIWNNIIPGKIQRYIIDNTQLDTILALLSQSYVLDDKKSVEDAIKDIDDSIKVTDYIRFELGEGIEKKKEDFAAEVAAQINK